MIVAYISIFCLPIKTCTSRYNSDDERSGAFSFFERERAEQGKSGGSRREEKGLDRMYLLVCLG